MPYFFDHFENLRFKIEDIVVRKDVTVLRKIDEFIYENKAKTNPHDESYYAQVMEEIISESIGIDEAEYNVSMHYGKWRFQDEQLNRKIEKLIGKELVQFGYELQFSE